MSYNAGAGDILPLHVDTVQHSRPVTVHHSPPQRFCNDMACNCALAPEGQPAEVESLPRGAGRIPGWRGGSVLVLVYEGWAATSPGGERVGLETWKQSATGERSAMGAITSCKRYENLRVVSATIVQTRPMHMHYAGEMSALCGYTTSDTRDLTTNPDEADCEPCRAEVALALAQDITSEEATEDDTD